MTSENIKTYANFVALSLSILLSSLSTSIANVALPDLAHSFHASMQEVQWVVLAYLLAITALIVSAGHLGDLIGRRRLLLSGLIVFAIASGLCALAADLWFLIAARALQGAGAAIMMALAMAMVTETLPKEKTGRAMGLLGSMSAIGTALGPALGGFLIGNFAWQAIFLITIPCALLTCLLVYRFLPIDRFPANQARMAFDYVGSLLLVCSLGTYALAMTLGRGNFKSLNAVLLLLSFIGFILFIRSQRRVATPLVHLNLFRRYALSSGFAMSALVTTVVMATLVVGPFYLAAALKLDTTQIGVVMSLGPIVAALIGLPAGRLSDHFGATKMCRTGLAVMLVGSSAMAIWSGRFGLVAYMLPLVLITAGYALFQAANNTAVMQNIAHGQRGLIAGLLNLARNLGLITGASLMGSLFAASSASHTASPDVISGLRVTFVVAAGLILLALVVEWHGRRWRTKPDQ
jgi:EmrB/QacA subfamily drug resistance transporter